MDDRENKSHEEIILPESLVKNLSFNQKSIIEILAKNPDGILSREISLKTGAANKSDTLKATRAILEQHGFKIHIKRLPKQHQYLWSLHLISSGE
jgi:hypothetical protein